MEYYNSYMNRQEIPRETHEKLLELEHAVPPKRQASRWGKYGALAACAALIAGAGMWTLIPAPGSAPAPAPSAAGQFAAGYAPLPGETDTVGPENLFTVSGPEDPGKLMFPMVPAILYSDRTSSPETAASRAFAPGSYVVQLTKEDIRTIFWGPEGKPQAEHPKLEQGDLPWMLFWDGYTLNGSAWYDGYGQLTELTIYGTKDRAGFTLDLRPGALPFSCWMEPDRETSEFNGVEITGWRRVYDRDGDGLIDYICGSEFMTENSVGVRFENRNSSLRAEYAPDGNMDLGGAQTFNALFVRQAVTGGLYLDHLMTSETIPAWRDVSFETLAQARQETDFAPYLPTAEPEGYGAYAGNKDFYGRLSYQEDRENMLFVRWSRGYDDVEVCVYLGGLGKSCNLADPARPETYDLRLYSIPWCDSVPEEYRDTVNSPAFRAEDMSLAIVEARGLEKDTGGLRFHFEVLHPDGTVASYRCAGMTARQVWAMVEETLPGYRQIT